MSGRNIILTSLAGKFRAQGDDEATIYHRLLVAPERDGLAESECRAIARSIASKPAGRRLERPANGWKDTVHELAARRGWTVDALHALGAVAKGDEVHIPMRDTEGNVTGWRRRRGDGAQFRGGVKCLTVKGGKNGCIMPWPLPADGPVLVVEGEADACAALSAGWKAVVGKPGAKPGRNVLEYLQALLANRAVVLAPDPDEDGRKGADETALALVNAKCRVRIVPALPKLDLDKRLARVPEAERAAELARLVEASIEWSPPKETPGASPRDDKRVQVVVFTDEGRVNDAALSALSNDPDIYHRAGALVTVTTSDAVSPPRIIALGEGVLRDRLARVCRFVRVNAKDELEPCHVPGWTTKALFQRGDWPGIQPLAGIIESPTIRADGTILKTPGYDRATGLFLVPGGQFPEIPDGPTKDEAIASANVLLELAKDFPWKDSLARSGWLAYILTIVGRQVFDGPSPLFAFDANTRGSGKTLAATAGALIATGRIIPGTTHPKDDDEFRKLVTSIALEALPVVLLDNIAGALGSPSLDAALTATTWRDRILGRSETSGSLPLRTTWASTGNNVVLKGDTVRRVLLVRLESPEENPENQTNFTIPDLLGHIRQERPRLLVHALTCLRAWFVAGQPRGMVRPFGSFEAWAGTIAECVAWLGLGDVVGTRMAVSTAEDRDRLFLEGIIAALERHTHAAVGASASEIAKWGDDDSDLGDMLVEALGERNVERLLAYRLRDLKGRVVGGKRVNSRISRGRTKWFIESAPGKVVGMVAIGGHSTPIPTREHGNPGDYNIGTGGNIPTNQHHPHHGQSEPDEWADERQERMAIEQEGQP